MIDNTNYRRIRLDYNTSAELAIRAAVTLVEDAGAHPLLTDAVILLGQAREKVADFVDLNSKVQADEINGDATDLAG